MKKLLLVLSLVALASVAFGQSSNAPLKASALFSGPHSLRATYISSGDLGAAVLSAGEVPLDSSHTISCPGTTGNCVIQADSFVQIGESPSAGNEVALCLYVDGALVNSNCYFGAVMQADNSWIQTSTSITSAAVPPGTHHVQTHVFTTGGAKAGFFKGNYKVFKP